MQRPAGQDNIHACTHALGWSHHACVLQLCCVHSAKQKPTQGLTNSVFEDNDDRHDGPHGIPTNAVVQGPGVVEHGDESERQADLEPVHRLPGIICGDPPHLPREPGDPAPRLGQAGQQPRPRPRGRAAGLVLHGHRRALRHGHPPFQTTLRFPRGGVHADRYTSAAAKTGWVPIVSV